MFGKADKTFSFARAAASSLAGKHVAVVGGTDGLGRAIARLAASQGSAVTVVGRTNRDAGVANMGFMRADLSSMSDAARVARELPGDLDAVVLTTGIMPGPTRTVTAEGIEMDMAVSTLSRHVMLKSLMPRLPDRARVFVMGMPGSGQWTEPRDLNSEASYGGMGTHGKTVVGNEALVLHWAAAGRQIYGLNPGFVRSNIRSSFYGGKAWLSSITEGLMGLLFMDADQYARNIVPLLTAPELASRPGLMFGRKGTAILPTPELTQPANVAAWMAALDELAARAAAAGATAGAAGGAATGATAVCAGPALR